MVRVDYDGRLHTVYAAGQAISADVVAGGCGRLPGRRPLVVVDLGSGVGRFSPALAETFGGPAYGVEPSSVMRRVAEEPATDLRCWVTCSFWARRLP